MTKTSLTDMTHQSTTGWRPDLRSPIVIGLAALLIIQLLLALALGLSGGRTMAPTAADEPLFGFTPEQVKGVRIESGDGAEAISLVRRDDAWVIENLADLPVQGAKLDQLLDDLGDLKRPLPIATSEAARKRFKVADSAFERRLVIDGEQGPIGSLLIGDSPGFRRVFARPGEDQAVYDLRIALSDVSPRRDDWIDPGLLRLESEEITRIATNDWTLAKGEDGVWALADSDQAPDQEAVTAMVMRLANLSYRGVLGVEDSPAYNQQDPLVVLDIGLADGATRSYRISKAQDSEDYVLRDTARPWYFKLSEVDLGELHETTLEDLLGTAEEETTDMLEAPGPAETSAEPEDLMPPVPADTDPTAPAPGPVPAE
jgi:hypothetical protein